MIRDNFCFDASLEKFHSPSQEGGVSSSLPDGSVDDIGEKMVENDVFLECTSDLGQLLLRCLP